MAGFLFLAACSAQGNAAKPSPEIKTENPTQAPQPSPEIKAESPTQTPQPPPAAVIVTPAIKQTIARLKVGETFELQIPTIPKEGFEWKINKMDENMLAQEGRGVYVADTRPTSAGGMYIFRFKALARGNTVVTFVYSKPASEGIPALTSKTLSVSVEVS